MMTNDLQLCECSSQPLQVSSIPGNAHVASLTLPRVVPGWYQGIHFSKDLRAHDWYPDSKVHGANMGPSGAGRTQVGPMLGPWTLSSGYLLQAIFAVMLFSLAKLVYIFSVCHNGWVGMACVKLLHDLIIILLTRAACILLPQYCIMRSRNFVEWIRILFWHYSTNIATLCYHIIKINCFAFPTADPDVSLPMDVLQNNKLLGSLVGTVTGGALLVTDTFRTGLLLDGASQYVNFGTHGDQCFNNPGLCTHGITFAFWLKMLSIPSSGSNGHAIILDNGGVYVRSVGFSVIHKATQFEVRCLNLTHDIRSRYVSLKVGSWTHVMFTWKADQSIRLFINGCDAIYSGVGIASSRGLSFQALRPFYLGTSGSHAMANMIMDDLFIWHQVLSPDQIWSFFAQNGTE